MRRSPFFVSLPSATSNDRARPRSVLDPDLDITSPLLNPGLRVFEAAKAVSFCLATSAGEARRRLRPPERPRDAAGAAMAAERPPRGRPRPRAGANDAAARFPPVWSARSLKEADLIASSTDETNDVAIRSSSVRRVPIAGPYCTAETSMQNIIGAKIDFSIRLSSVP
jgi:hypothetical protein